MIDKALYIIIFFYAAGFMMLGSQYVLGDVYHIQMTNLDGDPLQSGILEIIDTSNVNTVTANIANSTDAENSTLDAIVNAFQIGFNVSKDLLLLLTGTYIFNLMFFFGVPPIIIAGFVALYLFCVGRTVIAYVRGV